MINGIFEVYNQLKDKYPLVMTNSFAVEKGFEIDVPIIVGRAHGQVIWLYEYCGEFVLDVMDDSHTKGTHWHPFSIDAAIADIEEFMQGKCDYKLTRFPK